ncbi:MAG: IS66 family transposase [Desulfoprunum sp.]|uniref:IS66 family transposase n=1 Tax=Desulfoprunum sp. TaxID=2020866 RepID=UPI003C76B06F
MTVDNINVEATVKRVTALIAEEKDLSPALKSSLEVLLLLVSILVNRLGLNSRNSSKPPAADPFRKKERKTAGGRKPGGQHGHVGKTLQQFSDPDIVKPIPIDRDLLPPGEYKSGGHEARQVIDLDIGIVVTEWQAEILVDQNGKKHVAPFPEGVTRPIQYGIGIKINSVYMSQYQMIPYNRIEEQFADQLQIPISAGSIVNFNRDAFERLELFEAWVKNRLAISPLVHLDETGVNVNSSRYWLHNTSTDSYSYFYPHQKRGGEALDEIGILSGYQGILCHDHWKPYFNYGAAHALCNAHHLRELERAAEQDGQKWAKQMSDLLLEINRAVDEAGGSLDPPGAELFRQRYREVLTEAEIECPEPKKKAYHLKPGRIARSKARNLLERLKKFEDAVLRFMVEPLVPFSNNQAENDLRMIKVQQKVSGCFRSMDGAKVFCRIRSYLTTCRKQSLTATEALRLLFEGKWPAFMIASDVLSDAE